MDINNFTGVGIRLGEFPQCLDITSIPDFHSSHGLMAYFFGYQTSENKQYLQIRRNKETKEGLLLFIFRWPSQEEGLPSYAGDIVFDSRHFLDTKPDEIEVAE